MIHKISVAFILFYSMLFISADVNAQGEVLLPLNSNQVIKEYRKTHPDRPSSSANKIRPAISSVLPIFFDDFSRGGIYPNSTLWTDSNAFINETFCDNPPTIGVATLDGINKYGNPYNPTSLSSNPDTADFLTSIPININASDTGLWFSFYYQPQGFGEEPDLPDSLTLQFLSSTGEWNEVWSVPGHPNVPFKRVNIHLIDAIYRYPGFRFRFMNYATLNGNLDHWNIDYVFLAKGQSQNDTVIKDDIAFVNPIKSFLKEFAAMPYSHYKDFVSHGNSPVKDSINDIIRSYKVDSTSTYAYCNVRDQSGSLVLHRRFFPGLFVPVSFTDELISTQQLPPLDTVFPIGNTKYTDFFVRQYFSSISSNTINDTADYIQHFQNYYAYDDGTAEVAYGVNVANAKVAYRFDVKMADTLRAVQIYFNQVGEQVHNKLFQLCLWSDVNVGNNTDHIVYKMINQKPANVDSINGFATYIFDTLLVVPAGPMYVGWIQNDATLLGMGVDRNTPNNNKMFYNLSGIWYQSHITGTWMMRPLFGDSLIAPIGINEPVASSFSFNVYPNPASSSVSVEVRSDKRSLYNYQLLNYLGEIILTGTVSSGKINLSNLSNGFYFVRLTDGNTKESVTKKLVVQHD